MFNIALPTDSLGSDPGFPGHLVKVDSFSPTASARSPFVYPSFFKSSSISCHGKTLR